MQDQELFRHALDFAEAQTERLIEREPCFYPMYTQGGRWRHQQPVWTHWCDGFLPGMMWIFASRAGVESERGQAWRERAIRYTTPLEPRKLDRDVHDLGFIFMSTYHRWHQLEPSAQLNDVLIDAGRTMALRFREKGNYLRSFISEDSLFIDIMMNVGIVFYAARETGDADLLEKAIKHCLTTRRYLVRGDGSTAHEGLFDLKTGEFLRQSTHQGFRGDSCWSRGLAWALYGFCTAYTFSGGRALLKTSEACADYYIKHITNGGIPPWDFDAPGESRRLVDTSAAAIAASGLLRLSHYATDEVKGQFYRRVAVDTLRKLSTDYLAESDPAWEGVLKGGVYHLHKNLGVNESVIWGDYFFVEALDRLINDRGQRR